MKTRQCLLWLVLCFFAVPQPCAQATAGGVFLASAAVNSPALPEETWSEKAHEPLPSERENQVEQKALPLRQQVAELNIWLGTLQDAARALQESSTIRLADLNQGQREALAVLLHMVALPAEIKYGHASSQSAFPGNSAISAALEQKEAWQRWQEGLTLLRTLNAEAEILAQRLNKRARYHSRGSYWGTLSAEQYAEPATEPATDQIADQIAEQAAEPAAEQATDQATEQAADRIAEPAAEPATEALAETLAAQPAAHAEKLAEQLAELPAAHLAELASEKPAEHVEAPFPSEQGTRTADLENKLGALHAELAEYWFYLILLDEFHGQWQNPATLLPLVENALARQPHMPLLLLTQAELLLQQERPRAALAPVNAALAVLENSPLGTVAEKKTPSLKTRALRLRGLIQLHTGQAALAEEDMSTALTREPANAVLWLTRGAIRQVRGNAAGMCLDYAEACNYGLCEGLEAAREENLCLP